MRFDYIKSYYLACRIWLLENGYLEGGKIVNDWNSKDEWWFGKMIKPLDEKAKEELYDKLHYYYPYESPTALRDCIDEETKI